MKKYIPLLGSILLLGCQSTQEASVANNSTSVIANNSTSVIANNSTSVIANNSTSAIANNSTSAIANNSTSAIANNSTSAIANNSTSAIANNSTSAIANNLSSAVEMTPEKFTELTDGIPKAGKFDSFKDLYRSYIAEQGLYYSDVTLSEWKGYKNTYEMPILIISSKDPRFKSYDAQTAMGVEFTVVRVDMYDNRITINNGTLGKLDVEKAKELDGSVVRIYYKLSNKDDFLNYDKTTINSVCHDIRWSTPKVTEPFDYWDHGCELNADIIAIKSLKLNENLPFVSSKSSVMNKYNNYNMQSQGLKYISEH